MSTSMFHIPGVIPSSLKFPEASVTVRSTRSPCVARTDAPGITWPSDLTVPVCATAIAHERTPASKTIRIQSVTNFCRQRGSRAAINYCFFNSSSRGPRPLSAVSFIVLPETVPSYLVVNLPLSPNSRVSSNMTLSPMTIPFSILIDRPTALHSTGELRSVDLKRERLRSPFAPCLTHPLPVQVSAERHHGRDREQSEQ